MIEQTVYIFCLSFHLKQDGVTQSNPSVWKAIIYQLPFGKEFFHLLF